MPYQPNLNFTLSDGRDLGSLGWITKEYLMTVYPQIAGQLITPELWSWGFNLYASLGNNVAFGPDIRTPITTFAGGANWKQVSNSRYDTRAIKTDGTLWSWGLNVYGQLGDNTTNDKPTPVPIFAGGTNWKQVASGVERVAAIKTDGTLWVWGYNNRGQLGDNTTTQRQTPVTTFAGGTNWKQVACGGYHTAAIKTDGTLWIWGRNAYAQLGDNTTVNKTTPVTTFAGGTNWKQVSCGRENTAAIKTDGTLWGWGRNAGQVGDNTFSNRSTPVTTFAGGSNWKQVECANRGLTIAAIKTDGTLWVWGPNGIGGQLGINEAGGQKITPVTTFAGGTNWKQVALGYAHITAIKTDGTLWIWGNNYSGRLGINAIDTDHRFTPVTTFAGGTNWKQVSGGYTYVSAIRTSDDLQGI